MGFIQREIEKINDCVNHLYDIGESASEQCKELYVARQALMWALEPTAFKSPYDMVLEIESCHKPPIHPILTEGS